MITCKYCEEQFEDTLRRCPACGTKAPKGRDKKADLGPLVLLTVAQNLPERDVVLAILDSEGIPYVAQANDVLGMGGILGDFTMTMQTNIHVQETEFERASALLKDLQSTPLDEELDGAYWEVDDAVDEQEA